VLEILGHLEDVEIIYGYRLRQMLADTKRVIAPLDQNAWTRNLNYLDSPPSELVVFYWFVITTCVCCEVSRLPTFSSRPFTRSGTPHRAIFRAGVARGTLEETSKLLNAYVRAILASGS